MELFGWLSEPSRIDVDELPDPSTSILHPPAFLSLRKTKPAKREAASTHSLTPFESRMKDIIVRLYSDQEDSRGSDSVFSEASTPVPHSEKGERSSVSEISVQSEQESVIQESTNSSVHLPDVFQPPRIPVHILRAEIERTKSPGNHSAQNVRPKSSSTFDSGYQEPAFELLPCEGVPLGGDLQLLSKMADTGTLTPLSSVSEDLSVPFFSASDRDIADFSDPQMPPSVPPLQGLPYALPKGIPDAPGESNIPLALRRPTSYASKEFPESSLNADPSSNLAFSPMFLYSHTDSRSNPRPHSGNTKPRSQVIESFGVNPQMLPSPTSRSRRPHFSHSPPLTSLPRPSDAGRNRETEDTSQTPTTTEDTPIGSNLAPLTHSTPPNVSQPALQTAVSETHDSTGAHTSSALKSSASNPSTSPISEPLHPTLFKSSDSSLTEENSLRRNETPPQSYQKPIDDTFHSQIPKPELGIMDRTSADHTAGSGKYNPSPGVLTPDESPIQATIAQNLPLHDGFETVAASKMEDIETTSAVSIQQLLESLQSEPPDLQSVTDDAAVSVGTGTFPLPPPSQLKDSDRTPTPTGSIHTSFPPVSPSPSKYVHVPMPQQQNRYTEPPTATKMPPHIQPSPKITKKTPFSPLSPKRPVVPSDHIQTSLFGTNPITTSVKMPSGIPNGKKPANTAAKPVESTGGDSLEQQLTDALQAKANLEGQLESVVEECKATLKDRADLQSRLARAEAELATAAERERTRPRPKFGEGGGVVKGREIEQLKADLKETRDGLEQEKRAVAALKNEVAREKQKARELQNDLAESQESLKAHESVAGDLQEKLSSLQASADKKGEENQELECKLSSLQASYEALGGTKAWLHDQLQDALETKLKLQEDLRESKATAIAQSIKMDQLMKENTVLRQQVGDLQKGVLHDKAKLVSELEAIEADALSREDLCAQLVAEQAQLEDLVKMKEENLEKLGSDLARMQVERDELQQDLDKTSTENDTLARRARSSERENTSLKDKLRSMEQQLDAKDSDLEELEKLKSTLQQRLKESEAALVGKEGTLQGFKDAKDILKHELEMVKQARDAAEQELNDAKKEAAELEADLKTALDANLDKVAKMRSMAQEQLAVVTEKQLMEAQLVNAERELAQKSGELTSLESQSQDLMTNFKSLEDQFQSIAAESGSSHDNAAEKDRVISHLAAEKEKLEQDLSDAKAEQQHLQNKFEQLQQKTARMEGELEEASTSSLGELHKALRDKAQLQSDLNSMKLGHQEEMIKAQAKLGRMESDLKAVKKEAARAEKEWQKALLARDEKLGEVEGAKSQAESLLQERCSELEHALGERQAAEGALRMCEDQIEELKATSEQLAKQNEELVMQLQQEAAQKSDIERASSMVAMNLKQNAEERERKLQEQLRELSLEVERLRGRLAGINTAQVAMRDHAGALETTLAKRESSLVKLSAQAQKVLEEKEMEDQAFMNQVSILEQQLGDSQRELESLREEVLEEKKRAGDLEQELLQRDSDIAKLRLRLAKSEQDIPTLEEKVEKFSRAKDKLQSEVVGLRSQLVAARTSSESAERDLSDKSSQIEILQQELEVATLQGRQAGEEVKQLHERLEVAQERHAAEVENLKRVLSEVTSATRESSAVDARGLLGGPPPFDASLSSIGVDETDKSAAQVVSASEVSTSSHGSTTGKPEVGDGTEDPARGEVEKVERLNDTLRESSRQTISQLLGYNSLYRAHLREMGPRLEQARRQGQESAELKKSGEISVLRDELGSKSKTITGLQSCLLSLKEDMNMLHQQMDRHSATLLASHQSSRQFESQIEGLRRSSSLHTPLYLTTPPPEQSQ